MTHADSVVATFEDHAAADAAIKKLAASGFAMRNLSVVGKGYLAAALLAVEGVVVAGGLGAISAAVVSIACPGTAPSSTRRPCARTASW